MNHLVVFCNFLPVLSKHVDQLSYLQTRIIMSGGPNVSNICQKKPGGRFSWNLRLSSVDSSKVTELELGRIRKVVRPWIEVTKPETGGESGQMNLTLTAHTLGNMATGTTSQSGPLSLVGSSRDTVLSLAHFTGRF